MNEERNMLDRPPFSGNLKELKLNPTHNKIWELAKPLLVEGRYWDLWHTEISVEHMQKILKREGKENLEPVLIPAIILHDIGWSELGEEKNVSWGKSEMRVQHMKEGARLAREILEKVKYDKDNIDEIVRLIEGHDNAYLGIEPETIKEKLLRDADACFILSYVSFWKDYHVKGEKISLKEFESQFDKYGTRYTKTAQKITDEQIKERRKEIKDSKITPHQRYEEIMKVVEKKAKQVE